MCWLYTYFLKPTECKDEQLVRTTTGSILYEDPLVCYCYIIFQFQVHRAVVIAQKGDTGNQTSMKLLTRDWKW
jgi:hypothetical protein